MDSGDSTSRAGSEDRVSFCFQGFGSLYICGACVHACMRWVECLKNCHEKLSVLLIFLFSSPI